MTKLLSNLWMWTAIVTSILSSDIVLAEKYPTVAEITNDSWL